MELGEKIRQARETAGISQRQLCGDTITRNMLSRIEHGAVRPSMSTLTFLARQLGMPVSYFLDEETVTSGNLDRMARARACYKAGAYAEVLSALEGYRGPDEIFDAEMGLLAAGSAMALAEQALEQGRLPYAAELLGRALDAGSRTPYYGPELERRRLLLLGQIHGDIKLPADDRELVLRAKQALATADAARAAEYLDAAEDHSSQQWNYLRGECHYLAQEHQKAIDCFLAAQSECPKEVYQRLEECYRVLEDYKMAYYYACKQRE